LHSKSRQFRGQRNGPVRWLPQSPKILSSATGGSVLIFKAHDKVHDKVHHKVRDKVPDAALT